MLDYIDADLCPFVWLGPPRLVILPYIWAENSLPAANILCLIVFTSSDALNAQGPRSIDD